MVAVGGVVALIAWAVWAAACGVTTASRLTRGVPLGAGWTSAMVIAPVRQLRALLLGCFSVAFIFAFVGLYGRLWRVLSLRLGFNPSLRLSRFWWPLVALFWLLWFGLWRFGRLGPLFGGGGLGGPGRGVALGRVPGSGFPLLCFVAEFEPGFAAGVALARPVRVGFAGGDCRLGVALWRAVLGGVPAAFGLFA